jgi:RNA polymerase sigma factor (sigma-70 family)
MAMLPVQAPSQQGPIPEIRPRLAGSGRRGLAGRSDEALVAVAKQGDERAFEILYERHSPAILRYCRSLLRSTQEAEDVKQEVFVLAISALRRGAEPDAFRPWLYRVAHNACMSHLRVRRPVLVADNGVLVGPAGAAEPVDGHREELRQLLDDIGKLPDVQRGALLLREMDGFSYEQVGEVLGLPLSTVRASIFRARRTLQGLAEARDADCEEIQSELCRLADRRGRRGRHITTHLNVCPTCRDFRDGLRRRPAVLGGVQPGLPFGAGGLLLALKGKLLGGGAAAGGTGAALATGGGGAGVAKIAAVAASSIALLASAGVEADHVIDHSRREAAAAKRHVATTSASHRATRRGAAPAVAAAGVAAGPATAAGAQAAALRNGRLLATRPAAAARTTAGARAHTRRHDGSSGASTATHGHAAPRATVPAPPAAASGPGTATGRERDSSSRSGGRDGSRDGDRRHDSARGDDDTAPRTDDRPDATSGSQGSGHTRTTDPGDDDATRQESSAGGGAPPPDEPDESEPLAPPHSSGPSSPAPPPQTAPAPAPVPSGGTTPGSGSGTPAPAPAPPPPAPPAPPVTPPADPGPAGTTTSTITLPSDTGTAAVVPAP